MTELTQLINNLNTKDNLEWFDAICEILKSENCPTTIKLMKIIGTEKPNPNNEIRGSKFLIPFDKRFNWACINPSILETENDRPIDYLSFSGQGFELHFRDIVVRFPKYRTQINTYDGGTQIFFYPIPEEYEFSGIAFWTPQEKNEIKNINDLTFKRVTFKFGSSLILGRDGYSLKR